MDFLVFTGLIMVCAALGGIVKILQDLVKTLSRIEEHLTKNQSR